MFTVNFAQHIALLEPLYGCGRLVLPPEDDDLLIGWASLHEFLEVEALAELSLLGFVPSEDEEGWPCYEQVGSREVLGLYGVDSIVSDPSFEQLRQSFVELDAAVRAL